MAAPTIRSTSCNWTASATTHDVTLPSGWQDGDLCVVFCSADGGRVWQTETGWTLESKHERLTSVSGAIYTRQLQSGDSNPQFDKSASDQSTSIAVAITTGTYDTATPVDAVPTSGNWDEGQSTTPSSEGVTTSQVDCLGLAFVGCDQDDSPFTVTTGGWSKELDCQHPANSSMLASKDLTSSGATNDVAWSQNASRNWCGAVIAIAPAAAAGVTIEVPLETLTLSDLVPDIAAGAAVEVPLETLTLSGLVPDVAAGAAVDVPLETLTITGLLPTIEAGGATTVEVPLETLTLSGLVPDLAAGAAVEVPLETLTITGLIPTIAAGAVSIDVPLDTLTLAGQIPTLQVGGVLVDVPRETLSLTAQLPDVAAGAAVDVPLESLTFTSLLPAVSAGIMAFDSFAIETDADRASFFREDNVTIVHSGVAYLGISSEVDGETLGGGTDVDGWIEVLMNTSDVESSGMAIDDDITVGAATYSVAKIDPIGGGMSVVHVMP